MIDANQRTWIDGAGTIFVTSFTEEMFEESGRDLVASFAEYGNCDDVLLCFPEGFDLDDLPSVFFLRVLETHPLLAGVLEANKDVIPKELGGELEVEALREIPDMYWNLNWSKWYRKVVCLYLVMALGYPTPVVWLDSDTILQKDIDCGRVADWFRGHGIFYFQAEREAPDTALIGFDPEKGGRKFVEDLLGVFVSKRFDKFKRWDDGYIIGQLLKYPLCKADHVTSVDLCKRLTGRSEPIPQSPAGRFVRHKKGTHSGLIRP